MSSNMQLGPSDGFRVFDLSQQGVQASGWKKSAEGKWEQLRVKVEDNGGISVQVVTQSAFKHFFSNSWGVQVKTGAMSTKEGTTASNDFKKYENKMLAAILQSPTAKTENIGKLFQYVTNVIGLEKIANELLGKGEELQAKFAALLKPPSSTIAPALHKQLEQAFAFLRLAMDALQNPELAALKRSLVDSMKSSLNEASKLLFFTQEAELHVTEGKINEQLEKFEQLNEELSQQGFNGLALDVRHGPMKDLKETLETITQASTSGDLTKLKAEVKTSLEEGETAYTEIAKNREVLRVLNTHVGNMTSLFGQLKVADEDPAKEAVQKTLDKIKHAKTEIQHMSSGPEFKRQVDEIAKTINEANELFSKTYQPTPFEEVFHASVQALNTRADAFNKLMPPNLPANQAIQIAGIVQVRVGELQKLAMSLKDGVNTATEEKVEEGKARLEHNNRVDMALAHLIATPELSEAAADPMALIASRDALDNAAVSKMRNNPMLSAEAAAGTVPAWKSLGEYFDETITRMQESFDTLSSFSEREDVAKLPAGKEVAASTNALVDLEGKPLVAIDHEDSEPFDENGLQGLRVGTETLPSLLANVEQLRAKYGDKWQEKEIEAYQELQVHKDVLLTLIAANESTIRDIQQVYQDQLSSDFKPQTEALEKAGATHSKGMILDIYRRLVVNTAPIFTQKASAGLVGGAQFNLANYQIDTPTKRINIQEEYLGEIPATLQAGAQAWTEGLESTSQAWTALGAIAGVLETYGQTIAKAEEHVKVHGYSHHLPEMLLTNVKQRVASLIKSGDIKDPKTIESFGNEVAGVHKKVAESLQAAEEQVAVQQEVKKNVAELVAVLKEEHKALKTAVKEKYLPEGCLALGNAMEEGIQRMEVLKEQKPSIGWWKKESKEWSQLSLEETRSYGQEVLAQVRREKARFSDVSDAVARFVMAKVDIDKKLLELAQPEMHKLMGTVVSKPQHRLAHELRLAEEREAKGIEAAIQKSNGKQLDKIAQTLKESAERLNFQLSKVGIRIGQSDYLEQLSGIADGSPEALAAKKDFLAEERQKIESFKQKAVKDFAKLNIAIAPPKQGVTAGVSVDSTKLEEAWDGHLSKLDAMFRSLPTDDAAIGALSKQQLLMLRTKREEALAQCKNELLEMMTAREKAVGAQTFYDKTFSRVTARIAHLTATGGSEGMIKQLEDQLQHTQDSYAKHFVGGLANSLDMERFAHKLGMLSGKLAAVDNKAQMQEAVTARLKETMQEIETYSAQLESPALKAYLPEAIHIHMQQLIAEKKAQLNKLVPNDTTGIAPEKLDGKSFSQWEKDVFVSTNSAIDKLEQQLHLTQCAEAAQRYEAKLKQVDARLAEMRQVPKNFDELEDQAVGQFVSAHKLEKELKQEIEKQQSFNKIMRAGYPSILEKFATRLNASVDHLDEFMQNLNEPEYWVQLSKLKQGSDEYKALLALAVDGRKAAIVQFQKNLQKIQDGIWSMTESGDISFDPTFVQAMNAAFNKSSVALDSLLLSYDEARIFSNKNNLTSLSPSQLRGYLDRVDSLIRHDANAWTVSNLKAVSRAIKEYKAAKAQVEEHINTMDDPQLAVQLQEVLKAQEIRYRAISSDIKNVKEMQVFAKQAGDVVGHLKGALEKVALQKQVKGGIAELAQMKRFVDASDKPQAKAFSAEIDKFSELLKVLAKGDKPAAKGLAGLWEKISTTSYKSAVDSAFAQMEALRKRSIEFTEKSIV